DIAGRDVILLHRLLKNSVTEKLGLRGYALFTNACLKMVGESPYITPHTESYEHIGEVQCGAYDLHAYEHSMHDTKRVYLEPRDADYIYERIIPASPELLWSFIIDPERRKQYQTIKELKPARNSSGRMGVGSEFHCDHGAFTRVTRMLDWRPFHYMTNITIQSFNKLPLKSPRSMVTFELIPVDAGHTKLSFRVRSLRRDWFTIQFMRRIAKHVFDKECNSDYNRLDKVLTEMQREDNINKLSE
ncbi:MAG TPA: SRPBCC domain-containing protein, partial [Chitinophagaceae bacterium]